MRKTSSRILAAVATAGLAASLSACQVKPGEYRIYKITQLDPELGADCGADVDIRDTSTFFGTQTIAIFATDPDSFFLEFGMDTITGERSGKDYTFAGESVEVDDAGMATITVNHKVDVGLSINVHEIAGDYTFFDSTACAGTCDGVPVGQCTITGKFIGTEIKDVELERPI